MGDGEWRMGDGEGELGFEGCIDRGGEEGKKGRMQY